MPKDRFFTKDELTSGKSLLLEGDEARHMRLVMRKSAGDAIELINGKGVLAKASIESESKKGITLNIIEVETEDESNKNKTHLIQAVIRPQKVELVVEKAVELGADHITLFEAEFSDKKQVKKERLEHITISALKQSGRLFMPKITYAKSLDEALSALSENAPLFYGDIEGGSVHDYLTSNLSTPQKGSSEKELSSLYFVIGPEGGLSPKEIELLKKHKAQSIRLGPYILRSETASLLACGFMNMSS